MAAQEILDEIKPLGSESYKRVIFRHGVQEPCFGVKIGDMQKIVKRIKKDYQLALDLYDTGVYDAMYVVLANRLSYELWTDDQRLLRALGGTFTNARWIGDYEAS